MNDFENGFSITRKESKRKMPYYEVEEIKITDHCPYCQSENIRRRNQKKTRYAYVVIDDDFAYCRINRWQYFCKECNEYFLNTEIPHAYETNNDFSFNFVEKALNLWMETDDEEGNKKRTLSGTAKEIGIAHSSMSDWNACLGRSLPEILPTIDSEKIVFASFLDRHKKRRGFICKQIGKSWDLIAFLDEYTHEWIGSYLGRLCADNPFDKVQIVYYDYAPKLGGILAEYFYNSKVCMNLNNLYQRACRGLEWFFYTDAHKFRTELSKMTNVSSDDSWLAATAPEKIREIMKRLPEEHQKLFYSLLSGATEDQFIMNTIFNIKVKPNIEYWRNKIKKMVANNYTYETIVAKILYDKPEYREKLMEGIKKAAETYGRRFDFILPRSY